ncbi:L,D-transpeptidase family protein [Chitinophaga sp. YIM B06452]|uniref:L,D-transpeptidase family protein n=1 Tax=Chitinophaga sp. YIM B06452 TaxID=3082158 RepID=UPI0031FF38BA
MLKKYLLPVFAMLTLAACKQGGKSKSEAVNRDTTHYTKEEYIAQSLDSNKVSEFLARHAEFRPYSELIKDFYRKRDFHYAWINEEGITEQAGGLLNMMRQDAESGIKDSTLNNSRVSALYDSIALMGDSLNRRDTIISVAELSLTAEFFVYANKVWGGMTSDNAKDLEWFIPRKKINVESLLDSIVRYPKKALASDEPVNRQYKLLRDQLSKMGDLVKKHPQQDSIRLADKKKTFKSGDSSDVIAAVKSRLALYGDYKEKDTTTKFTPLLDSALRNYQTRMGQKPDGIIRQQTVDALNRPLQHYMHQILLNMERLRWVPVEVTTDYILVNIPEFRLHAYEDGKLAWSCNVVVGTPGASTVIFSKDMQYVVFSPYWNVPPGILKKEVLPGIRKSGAAYLRRHNMEMTGSGNNISVRQKPGPSNSLGKVKFLFPNEYNIYLHDTPAKNLFSEAKRSFSHGCIRVSEPKHLAQWVLRKDSSWNEQKIDAAMNAGKEKYVTLKNKLPVYIGYFTSWVDSQGRLNFRDDVYGHDARLAKLLFGQ